MLFSKEINQGKIKYQGKDNWNTDGPVINTIVSSYQELINKIIDSHNNNNGNDPFSFLHAIGLSENNFYMGDGYCRKNILWRHNAKIDKQF